MLSARAHKTFSCLVLFRFATSNQVLCGTYPLSLFLELTLLTLGALSSNQAKKQPFQDRVSFDYELLLLATL